MPYAVSVVVPSWRRPLELERCLRAIAAQTLRPAQIVVGARDGDPETLRRVRIVAPSLAVPTDIVVTHEPGVIAAMTAALARCTGDLVAFTDDDAEPRADWLERLVPHFSDPRVAGAGGRDWQPHERGMRRTVGKVQWFGRVIGNHHLGTGPARPVDVLKGANCAFRVNPLRDVGFDGRLKGAGAQLHWELALCLALRRRGWTLIYDPAAAVDHHVAPRAGDDQIHRGAFSPEAQFDAVHNATLALLEHLGPARCVAFLAWALLIGTRLEPGAVQCVRALLAGDRAAWSRARATLAGRRSAWRAWRAWRAG